MDSLSRSSSSTRTSRRAAQPANQLGVRLRQLRIAAGMTQTELAGERFSKEYVSQIERGKTRPTGDTVEWLAGRLGVDAAFLATGVSADQRGRVEAALARAEALATADDHEGAIEVYTSIRSAVAATGLAELEVRALNGEAVPLVMTGQVREALDLLHRARGLTESPRFSDLDRAEVLYRMGVCRYRLSSTSTAIGLLNEALELSERSGLPCDHLRANVLQWRARCYRRQRDFEAAREDVERALQLAEGVDDPRLRAHAYFQASLGAERDGHWLLARNYAERAKAQYEQIADRANVGKLLNNLGGLNFLLGNPSDAIRYLKDAFATALEVGSETDAAYAVSSLAQVHLRIGDLGAAEEQARHALKLLEGREDVLDEIGNAQLVLGRSLLEQARLDEAEACFHDAQESFDAMSSLSHRANAWIARGDLAARRGDDRTAARFYRMAAEALQDVRF
jgi:tetratricopeptide (TPR) repeat protein/DNA-binding XRE family transcriptional regulator